MPSRRPQPNLRALPSAAMVGPACLAAGLFFVGPALPVNALVVRTAATTAAFRGLRCPASHHRRSCVRPRGAGRLSLSAPGGSGAEDMDSSDIYADLRYRLEELEVAQSFARSLEEQDQADGGVSDSRRRNERDTRGPPGGGGGNVGAGTKAYSGQEMKKAYYEAFWRARNLHKEARFEGGGQGDKNSASASDPPPPPTAQAATHATALTPMAMELVMSRLSSAGDATAATAAEVQGLTQMYYLDEEAEKAMATPERVGQAAVTVASGGVSCGKEALPAVAVMMSPQDAGALDDLMQQPQGLSQLFYLEAEEEEKAAAALPRVSGRSFLREKLGVPGVIVQDLRQVELDHARLAMLAVLLSGAVGAGAGVADTHVGFSALAEVARTPWLDPCVASVILAAKALSEGDWRIGKGALSGWADQALSVASNSGAKLLHLSSGDEMRKLAVEMEVKHGRMALGAVVCAMAQQGLVAVGA